MRERQDDALAVLKSSTRKIARVTELVRSATQRREEVRLRELIELKNAIGDLADHVDGAIDSFQKCFADVGGSIDCVETQV